ncbi:hypothetical protein U9M48_009673 [Paspalum notatum var. saurae]|uniref:Uncharacterized protein n=1 Tax=Paspalum notatum var. saurae TaxID=547442 RepID=A0AAQ3WFM7_PASNO
MARRYSSSLLPSPPWPQLLLLLLVLAVLGDAVAAVAVPRPLLGIAEPPASTTSAAAGPRPGGGGRPDRSEAGAEVILAGFAAAVMVVIFCYIRVTRKHNGSVGLALGEKQQQGSLRGFPTLAGRSQM